MTRAERHEQFTALRAQGLTHREIAERCGVAKSTVANVFCDPTGEKNDARRHKRHGICVECGAKTYNGGARDVPRRCHKCVVIWTPETVIAAIQDWADEHGGVPPTQPAWSPAHPNSTEKSRAEYATGRWPSVRSVGQVFGSWNEALLAAGFEPHLVRDRTPAFDVLVAEVRAGHSARELAARYGVTEYAIWQRFKNRGLHFADFKPKVAA